MLAALRLRKFLRVSSTDSPSPLRSSKRVLQSELDTAGGTASQNSTEGRSTQARARVPEVHMVECIEHLSPELHGMILDDPEPLHDSDVPGSGSRPRQNISPGVAEGELRGSD